MPRRLALHLLAAAQRAGDHTPDADLLRRYARDRDAAAFELLVHRHAPAVWTACRGVLRSEADAEDAFQTTFLVLARRASSVRGPSAGGWLYRVAVNTALKLRVRAARVAPISTQQLDTIPAPSPGNLDSELATAVQEEVARLPERYRLPIVLCDLEGHTHAAAAGVLHWPVGSVSGRLSRARDILRRRLTLRGLTPSAGGLLVLPAGGLSAGLVRAATGAASGAVPVSPSVVALTAGVLSAMRIATFKLVAAVVASAGAIGLAGVGTAMGWQRPAPPIASAAKPPLPREVATTAPPKLDVPIEGDWVPKKLEDPVPTAFPDIKPPDAKLGDSKETEKACPRIFKGEGLTIDPADGTDRRLLKARLRQGVIEVQRFTTRVQLGTYASSEMFGHVGCLKDVQTVVEEVWANDRTTKEAWLKELLIVAKNLELYTVARMNAGTDPPQSLPAVRRHRLAVEAALWKATHPKAP